MPDVTTGYRLRTPMNAKLIAVLMIAAGACGAFLVMHVANRPASEPTFDVHAIATGGRPAKRSTYGGYDESISSEGSTPDDPYATLKLTFDVRVRA